MKVFKMNDYDWVCARDEEQAKEFYIKETGLDSEEVDEEFQGEVHLTEKMAMPLDALSIEEQKKRQEMVRFGGELWVRKTFEWIIENEKIKQPCIIASTEF